MHRLKVLPNKNIRHNPILLIGLVLASLIASFVVINTTKSAQAACAPQPTTHGKATATINVPSSGTYRVWTRMMAPDTNNNSYILEIDDTTCGVVVGDSNIAASQWTWVNYKSGNQQSLVSVQLSAGNHTVTLIGKEAGVKVDKLLFTESTSCIPSGTGANCEVTADTEAPKVSVQTPANGATVVGTSPVTANVTDNVGVTKVEFRVDGQLKETKTEAPYTMQLDSTTLANGAHTVVVKAYDAAGNTAQQSRSFIVSNPQQFKCADMGKLTQDPVTFCEDFAQNANNFTTNGGSWATNGGKYVLNDPVGGGATPNNNIALHKTTVDGDFSFISKGTVADTANEFNDFSVIFGYKDANNYYFASFNESNDNQTNGIFRVTNGTATELANFANTITPGQEYAINVVKQGNKITVYNGFIAQGSVTASVPNGKVGVGSRNDSATFDDVAVIKRSTPLPGDTTKPSAPASLQTTLVTPYQVQMRWNAATDNVGVVGYRVYRAPVNTFDIELLGNSTSRTFTDSEVTQGDKYYYFVTALDAAGNESAASNSITVTVLTDDAEPEPDAIPEDINADGIVDLLDFSAVVASFGRTGSNLGRVDVNQDGVVNIIDFSRVVAKFGAKS